MRVPLLPLEPDHPDLERLRRAGQKVRKRLAANKAVVPIPAEKAELWAVPRFFDAVECGRLMTIIDSVARPSKVYLSDHDPPDYRTSYSGDLDPRDPFVSKLERRISDLLGIDPSFGETIQGQRYLPGQQFQGHTDWFPANTQSWELEQDHGGQRSITAMAYLNPVEEGGATDFPWLDLAVEPKPGALLIWNNADPEGVPNPWGIIYLTPELG